MAKLWLLIASAYGFFAVALGAFGAHALKAKLSVELQSVWRTAVEYHFYHALALLAVGLLARQLGSGLLTAAGVCFALGVLIFSGSLYALALTGVRGLGAITPIGGLLFLIGWVCLLLAVLRME